MQNDETLDWAMKLGKERHPEALQHHHTAFANSVQTLVTGWSGGFGGPSMCEHWACRVAEFKGTAGQFSFDDAPGEVEVAQRLLAMHHQRN